MKENTRTKILLNFFLNHRVPILEEYNPEKVVCYLYHRKGVRTVTAKDAIELAENQLHGLQVRSIHLALSVSSNYYKIYRVTASNNKGELNYALTYGHIHKEFDEEIKDPVLCEQALSLLFYLSDFIYKNELKYIISIKIDLISDLSGQFHIIKIKDISLSKEFIKSDYIIRGIGRNTTLKMTDFTSDDDNNLETDVLNPLFYKNSYEKDQKKREGQLKIQLKKPTASNSNVFLEMIAKTIDRDRKNQEFLEIITDKRKDLEQAGEIDNKKLFKQRSLKKIREKFRKKPSFKSINDLMFYVEKTRPRI